MTMFEYAKNAYKSMKDKPKEERWEYFLDYYKWYAIAAVAIVALLIHSIIFFATRKDTVFGGVLVDATDSETSEAYVQELEEYLQLNTKKEQIQMQTGLALQEGFGNNRVESFQQILAFINSKSTDFLTAPETSFAQCAYSTTNMLADLRDHLDAQTLERLEGQLYYVDRDLIEQARNSTLPADIKFPDPQAPETMTDPVPVGINITGCVEFYSNYYLLTEDLYLALAVNTERTETVLEFLEFLGI